MYQTRTRHEPSKLLVRGMLVQIKAMLVPMLVRK
jgi:hypothetical protein